MLLRKLCTGSLGAIVGATSIIVPLAAAGPAAAGQADTSIACVPEQGYTSCALFTMTSADQTFTVPTGVTSVRAKVWGAGGGGGRVDYGSSGSSGAGGFTTGTLSVAAGQDLTLSVGQGGQSGEAGTARSFGGGGAAGGATYTDQRGGAGGGRSAVSLAGDEPTLLLLAGGGGGAGGLTYFNGTQQVSALGGAGGGGLIGNDAPSSLFGGSGGTQEAGGTAAPAEDPFCVSLPTDGGVSSGGDGGSASAYNRTASGGGGGGGYYGGGGGACAYIDGEDYDSNQGGAGGGGSSFLAATGITDGTTEGGQSGTTAATGTLPGGAEDGLRLLGDDLTRPVGTGSYNGAGGNGEIVLEWNVLPAPPAPGSVTSSGTGIAAESPDITVPEGGTLRLLDDESLPVTSLVIGGEGTYTVNVDTKVLTFMPVLGFSGAATPVSFRVTDAYAQDGDGTYAATVGKPSPPTTPAALSSFGNPNLPQVVHPQVPIGGHAVFALPVPGQRSAVTTQMPGGFRKVVPEGVYTMDPSSFAITFTPNHDYAGVPTPVSYRIYDSYGQMASASYQPHVNVVHVAVATASAPSLVKLTSPNTTVPVTCRVSSGSIGRCTVALTFRHDGHDYTLGTQSVRSVGDRSAVTVPVRINALGHYLAGTVGGMPATAAVSVLTSTPQTLHTSATTRFVNATVSAPRAVFFDIRSAALRPAEIAYLDGLRSKLTGVTAIVCTGNTEVGNNWFANWVLGSSRAAAVCSYLTRGTAIRQVLRSRSWGSATAGSSAAVRQQNRRVDVELDY